MTMYKIECYPENGQLDCWRIAAEGENLFETFAAMIGRRANWIANFGRMPENTVCSRKIVGEHHVYLHRKCQSDAYYGTVKITAIV